MTASKANYILAGFSGLLLTAALPKLDFSWCAWFSMIPFLMAIRYATPGQGFRFGFFAGMVHYVGLLYWLVYTMHLYGYLPIYQSVIILIMMAAVLSIFYGIFGWFGAKLATSNQLFLLPFVWTSLDYLRSFLFTGFPWGFIGHSQYQQHIVIQIADIVGVYGISFLIMTINLFLFLSFASFFRYRWKNVPIKPHTVGTSFLISAMILGGTIYYGQQRIQYFNQQMKDTEKIKISVIQGNVDQSIKWDTAFQNYTIKRYHRLSQAALSDEPQLIVWPETAAPFYFNYDRGLTKKVLDGIKKTGTSFLIGSPSVTVKNREANYYNSAFLINNKGAVTGKYDKVHLVPFGEYVPLKKFLPFVDKMVSQVGDFRSGKKGDTLSWQEQQLGVQICYEIIFPNLSRVMVKNGADLLVNITNDAWFGSTSAAYQHFAMAVFRAVENKRALARAANTGISGFIDPIGRIMAATPIYEEKIVTQSLPLIEETTIYSRYGDIFAMICLGLSIYTLIQGIFIGFKKRIPGKSRHSR